MNGSHPCTECGRYSFPKPKLCYWCEDPEERRARLPEVKDPPPDPWKGARRRRKSRKKADKDQLDLIPPTG